jgi:hypothetical protein
MSTTSNKTVRRSQEEHRCRVGCYLTQPAGFPPQSALSLRLGSEALPGDTGITLLVQILPKPLERRSWHWIAAVPGVAPWPASGALQNHA